MNADTFNAGPVPEALSPERLAEIAERAEAATPGPWGIYEVGGGSLLEIVADLEETGCGYRGRREIARFEDEPLDNDPTHRDWTAEEDWAQVQADARFAAHAREDVPALLADNARLRAQVAELLAERHTTNEALSDAAERMRTDRDRIANLEAAQRDGTPIPARWDRTVIHPEHPNGDNNGDTIVCCIANDGTKRPIGLFLDDEHREALGLLLVDPDGEDEGGAR